MSRRVPHDPDTGRDSPNGARSFLDYRGARVALVRKCPVAGHAARLAVYTTGAPAAPGGPVPACTRVRGGYVRGVLTWAADGPRFAPSDPATLKGSPDSRRAGAAPRGPGKGLPSAALPQTRPI